MVYNGTVMERPTKMSMTDRINTRIDPALKKKATRVFETLGVSEAEAIRMFYAQVALNKGIPFPVQIPNAQTKAAFAEAENPQELDSYASFEDLKKDAGV